MKVFFDMVGCRLNQAEIEQMAFEFRKNGHTIVTTPEEADSVVINTCTVTRQAASDSRQKIRQVANLGVKEVVATGCWSTLESQRAIELAENVIVVPNQKKDRLVKDLLIAHGLNMTSETDIFDLEPLSREPLPGLRQRTRAFIKVQDGCDNLCTFCVTRIARGKGVSRPVDAVIKDIRYAAKGGAQEIVLTGVHLGSWGKDLYPRLHLSDLIQEILIKTDIPRLRLSSLEPWDLDRRFLELWKESRMMPHLHLPLQSGCNSTLKRMLRKITTNSYFELVAQARQIIPGVAITTDIIAGFPGETDEEFEKTIQFVSLIGFAGAHIFTYSERQGTAAMRIHPSVPFAVRKQRSKALKMIISESEKTYQNSWLGKEVTVLWESSTERADEGWKMVGLSGNYLKVSAYSSQPIWNTTSIVKLKDQAKNLIFGEIVR